MYKKYSLMCEMGIKEREIMFLPKSAINKTM
jgi:hypothetical protein